MNVIEVNRVEFRGNLISYTAWVPEYVSLDNEREMVAVHVGNGVVLCVRCGRVT